MLRNITKEEAELFVKASKFYIEKDNICTEEFALSLHEILLLGETGFINSEELTTTWTVEQNNKSNVIIDRNVLFILHNNSDKQIKCRLSIKKLSKSGIEILSLVDRPDRTDFYNSLARFF